jgi:hypothetical protein
MYTHTNIHTHTYTCTSTCSGEAKGVLSLLGLPDSLIRNVIMSRDIVPRAFACDYSLVRYVCILCCT